MDNNIKKYDKTIFRAYDIRGIAFDQLSEDLVYKIGRILGSMIQELNQDKIITGCDARLSSPKLSRALKNGILDSGCNVCDLGIVATPMLYFATCKLDTPNGVMLTGSHNPKDYNGLKIIINGTSLTEDDVQNIYNRVINENYLSGSGNYKTYDITDLYISRIIAKHKLAKKLKVIIDAGNGAASEVAPKLFSKMNCDLTTLFCKLDGNFPNHHPDPSRPENLEALITAVKNQKADIGLAFDGDADRLGVITSTGKIIWPDRQMMLYSQEILKNNPQEKIVFDIKCSKYLADIITKNNGVPIMYKTGHSLLKKKMIQENAILAGEMSGHIFFKHQWYGFDDALYTAVRLLEILSNYDKTSDELFNQFPEPSSTPEINIAVPESAKFDIISKLQQSVDFPDANIITIDGLRVEFTTGWGLIRASNTTANLVMRFEADNKAELKKVQNKFKIFILKHFPEIKLPF